MYSFVSQLKGDLTQEFKNHLKLETAFKILRRRKTIGRHLTMNEHDEEDLSLKTVEDISRTAEKMCARLQEMGNEAIFVSFNKGRETTTYRTSQKGEIFLQKNPDFIENFKKHFCDNKTIEKAVNEKREPSKNILIEVKVSRIKVDPDVYESQANNPNGNDAIEKEKTSENIIPEVKVLRVTEVDESEDSSGTEMMSDRNKEDNGDSSTDDYASDEKTVVHGLGQLQNAEHSNGIPKKKSYSCDSCKRAYTSNSNLKRHIKIHENETIQTCVVCGEKFQTLHELQRHRMCHMKTNTYECDICRKLFPRSDSLLCHIKNIHKGIKPFKCDICGKCFPKSYNLKRHLRIHRDDKGYLCDLCGESNEQLAKFVLHECNFTNEQRFECEDCGEKFGSLSLLKKHRKTHSQGKPFLCETCGKAFRRKNRLKTHERVHTGDKPYLCQICGLMFSDTCNLRIHKRAHTGQRFYCSTCDKCFVYKNSLNRHEKSCTGKNSRVYGHSNNSFE